MNQCELLNHATAQALCRAYTAGGWTLRGLSDASGLSESSVRRYLAGERSIDILSLRALTGAMAVDVGSLIVDSEQTARDHPGEVRRLAGLSPRGIAVAERGGSVRREERQ